MVRTAIIVTALASAVVVRGATVDYDGTVYPEEAGFDRQGTLDVDRWLSEGTFAHHVELGDWAPPPYGEEDFYDYTLGEFVGAPFFAEWRIRSDAPDSEVHHQNGAALIVFVSGPVTYHFNMASGLARIGRGVPYPTVYFDIEPGIAHTYRLEVYGAEYFQFQIDGSVVDSGVPEGDFPTPSGLMSFGTQFYMDESTSHWDYVRFGTIPEPATFLLLLAGAGLVLRRRTERHR